MTYISKGLTSSSFILDTRDRNTTENKIPVSAIEYFEEDSNDCEHNDNNILTFFSAVDDENRNNNNAEKNSAESHDMPLEEALNMIRRILSMDGLLRQCLI